MQWGVCVSLLIEKVEERRHQLEEVQMGLEGMSKKKGVPRSWGYLCSKSGLVINHYIYENIQINAGSIVWRVVGVLWGLLRPDWSVEEGCGGVGRSGAGVPELPAGEHEVDHLTRDSRAAEIECGRHTAQPRTGVLVLECANTTPTQGILPSCSVRFVVSTSSMDWCWIVATCPSFSVSRRSSSPSFRSTPHTSGPTLSWRSSIGWMTWMPPRVAWSCSYNYLRDWGNKTAAINPPSYVTSYRTSSRRASASSRSQNSMRPCVRRFCCLCTKCSVRSLTLMELTTIWLVGAWITPSWFGWVCSCRHCRRQPSRTSS